MAILKVANTFFDDSGNSRIQVSTANTIQVFTSDSERLRVDPSGNLLIGRTTSTIGAGVRLDIAGGVNAASFFINGSDISTIGTSANAYATSVGASGNAYTASVGLGANSYAASVGVGANAYATSVGTSGNVFAASVGVGANAYATSVGASGNAYTNAANTSARAYTDTANASARSYATSVGTSGNVYAASVGVGANAYADTLSTIGKQTIWVPAGAMIPSITNGPAFGTLEMNTNKNMIQYLAYDSTTSEGAQFSIQMPKSWNESTVIGQVVWTHPTATAAANSVVWSFRAVATANNDTLDVAFGSYVNVRANGATANATYISPESAAITVAGTPGAEEFITFEVDRQPANTGDTMGVDARLLGVKIHYTIDAAKDN